MSDILAVGPDVTLDPAQLEIYESIMANAGTHAVAMGRGAGKSVLDRIVIHALALEKPRLIGLVLPTLKQAKQVFWPQMLGDLDYLKKIYRLKSVNHSDLLVEYANGSRLTLWGADGEHANRIRGQRFHVVIEDEADDIDPGIERAIIQPTFSNSGVEARWIKSGTPRRGIHGGLYAVKEAVRKKRRRHYCYVIPSSKSWWVDPDWLEDVKAEIDPAIYSREYECNFTSAEGLVYDLTSEHIATPPRDDIFHTYIIGADFGWVDAGVLLLIGIVGHGEDAIAWVLDEYYDSKVPIDIWTERLQGWWHRYRHPVVWPDSSRPDMKDNWRSRGIDVREADKAIEPGVARIANLLYMRPVDTGKAEVERRARLYVHPRCTHTIAEFEQYKRKKDPKNPDAYLEDIVDKHNHAMDALRYAILGHFGRMPNVRSMVDGR